ncbi:MAG: hypothetical protein JW934_19285 [Anaerolineae bacterium]|nr:hypothetical protein [Anaerolineae bacterium]
MTNEHIERPECSPSNPTPSAQAQLRFRLHRQFLVICSGCKRVRDDVGHWHLLDIYSYGPLPGQLSHGLCPNCAQRLYPEYFKD